MSRRALVFGASGFVGRYLVRELGDAGVPVATANRSAAAHERLVGWLGHSAPVDLRVDFAAPSLLGADLGADLDDVTEIYNCAGAYRFGMTADEAHRANVDSVRAIVAFAARLPRLRRLVHVSGYRVGGRPWDDRRRHAVYRELGAYEASKIESDAVLQAEADERGVPWTIVNPSTVIGESDQYLGLAATLEDLWRGRLPALPGDSRTFVPVVDVEYLARFMAAVAVDEDAAHTAYWVLDDHTPALPDLLAMVGARYGVRVPRLRIPVALIKRLPRRLTRADPETVGFLSADRYPTGPANAFATRHGLVMPDTTTAILRWVDHLAAHRFGALPSRGGGLAARDL